MGLGFERKDRCCKTLLALNEVNQETNLGFKCLIIWEKLQFSRMLTQPYLDFPRKKTLHVTDHQSIKGPIRNDLSVNVTCIE